MMCQCKKLWKQFLYEVDKAMDEQFEKTENSMSIYYTVNKMLIALHMAVAGILCCDEGLCHGGFLCGGDCCIYLFIPAAR